MKKKIFLTLVIAITLGVIALEFLPDPTFSPVIKKSTEFSFKIFSSGGMGEGLKVESLDEGIVSVKILSSNEWMLTPKTVKSRLEVNGNDQQKLLDKTEEEWGKPFIVRANPDKNYLPEEIVELPHALDKESSRILSNRRKSLARLIILPDSSNKKIYSSCYFGPCEVSFEEIEMDKRKIFFLGMDGLKIQSEYNLDLDLEGIVKAELKEKIKSSKNQTLDLNYETRALAVRRELSFFPDVIDQSKFIKISSISLEASSPEEKRDQLIEEMKNVKMSDLIFQGKQFAAQEKNKIGEIHFKLRKLLTARPEVSNELVQEIKNLDPKNSFYITSIAALEFVDHQESQKALRDLYQVALDKENILEARNLILGLGESKNPSKETIDLIMESAYSTFGEMNEKLSESAKLASGSLARNLGDSKEARDLLNRPFQIAEDYLSQNAHDKDMIVSLEVIGNSGYSGAFELIEKVSQKKNSQDVELSLINSVRFMEHEGAEKMLLHHLKGSNEVLKSRAKMVINLRCEFKPELCTDELKSFL